MSSNPVELSPQWVIGECKKGRSVASKEPQRESSDDALVDHPDDIARAIDYVVTKAPRAVQDSGGDAITLKVAERVKDWVRSEETTFRIMCDYYNKQKCDPEWPEYGSGGEDGIREKVRNAYRYGKNAPGCDATGGEQTELDAALHKMNESVAFVIFVGGARYILKTTDEHGRPTIIHLNKHDLRDLYASWTVMRGDKRVLVIDEWLRWADRTIYHGIVFNPQHGGDVRVGTKIFLNTWQGFAVMPAPVGAEHVAVASYLDHLKVNVCGSNAALYRWLLGFFAHLLQRPWEKPQVAIVFRGGKGTGKNVAIETIGHLLGSHFMVAANKRYMSGNFNSHYERLLAIVFDEAFWSGDKSSEGALKDLVTGTRHLIERKNFEPYSVANLTRVIILSNEEWVVPASNDERRFAFFDVGTRNQQDHDFFSRIHTGMLQGGYEILMRYLLKFDLAGLDFNAAPKTAGLLSQKIESADPLRQFWYGCLCAGHITGTDFDGGWPTPKSGPVQSVDCDEFRNAVSWNLSKRNIKSRMPADTAIGKVMASLGVTRRRQRVGNKRLYTYDVPSLSDCRAKWDEVMGQPAEWEPE